jgi:nucleotide-binding universal stress UspA family protein
LKGQEHRSEQFKFERMKPILLALSTFRQSDSLIQKAIQLARQEGRKLIVLFIIDINLARYLIDSQTIAGTHFRQKCEKEMLAEYKEMAVAKVDAIVLQTKEVGVPCETIIITGRFGIETVKMIQERTPEKVLLTRSKRPQWMRQLFGSPVDYIIKHANCPVLEDDNIKVAEENVNDGP